MTEHVESVKTYAWIWIALLCLTALTTAVAHVDLGPFSVVVALGIAVVKMLLVALFLAIPNIVVTGADGGRATR